MKKQKSAALLLLVVCAALFAGALWNHSAESHALAALPSPPGTFFDVDHHRMHLVCFGSGSPTILAESGASENSQAWTVLAPRLSQRFRFCAYDRAGFGLSETQPGPRDAGHIAEQLHALLSAAAIHGPLVLLGHSLGGLFIRAYTARYPDEISALIFLDSGAPAAYDGSLGKPLGLTPSGFRAHAIADLARWAALVSGSARLRGQCSDPAACRPAPMLEDAREFFTIQEDSAEVSSQALNLPVLILSEDGSPTVQTLEARAAWDKIQSSLLDVSPRSQRVIAIGGDHQLQLHCAGLVADRISTFLANLRDGVTPSGNDRTRTAPCKTISR